MSAPRILLLLGALLLAGASAPACPQPSPVQTVKSVYDGDTLTTHELGPVRLAGIDTPEIGHRARCRREADLGAMARNHLVARTANGVRLERAVDDAGRQQPDTDKYGRALRSAFAPDGGDLRAEMIRLKLAVPYWGRGVRMDWCAEAGVTAP